MMRMDDSPDRKPTTPVGFTVACVIIGACTFVVVFYLAAIAFMT
jgi:hypothetical protein